MELVFSPVLRFHADGDATNSRLGHVSQKASNSKPAPCTSSETMTKILRRPLRPERKPIVVAESKVQNVEISVKVSKPSLDR
jgi:hypothetical protein